MTDKAYAVPLHEQLAAIPEDIRIGVKDSDNWSAGTTWHPVGNMCHQAAAELRRLHEVNAELVEALLGVVRVADRATVEFDNAKAALWKAVRKP